jgi:hypothetical protein
LASGKDLEWEAEDFLELVYGERRGWIDLPAKAGGYWVPYHMYWEGEKDAEMGEVVAPTEVSRRVDGCLRDGESLYFSVCQFTERGRAYETALPSHWLWADLDEVDPAVGARALGLLPSLAWESSPGRWQALWRLRAACKPKLVEKVNAALTYALGADLGGWDLTQVLRLPGTRNYKYDSAPMVELAWYEEALEYDVRYVWSVVEDYLPAGFGGAVAGGSGVGGQRGALPPRAAALLRVPASAVVEGERSSRLWELECVLAEGGWGEDAIYDVVWDCAWNKWATVRTGGERLRREIRKAIAHVGRRGLRTTPGDVGRSASRPDAAPGAATGGDSESDDDRLVREHPTPFVRYASFMAMTMEAPRWMIEGLWTSGSHGILGGEPKTSKSTVALAMALSVASGKPFLRRYPVHTQGPVMMVQEENVPWVMQDRMRKIARYYGLIGSMGGVESGESGMVTVESPPWGSIAASSVRLEFPSDLPFHLLNNYGFDLSDEDHRELLEREISIIRPVLVVLDPLYLMFGGADMDKSSQVVPFLKWVMRIGHEYGCSMLLIHHFRKAQQSSNGTVTRSGQRLLGSGTFHGWVESALYADKIDEGEGWLSVRLEREFRNVGPRQALDIRLSMGEPGDLSFSATVAEFNMQDLLLSIVTDEPGVSISKLAQMTGMDPKQVRGRVRGSETMEATKNGRTTKVYLRAGSS